ncbi:MAG: 50S ribosomal protein L23 [Bacteroidales bacterium]|nr:50S ribosomal protein L23 [Bacteroidales bacterium]NCA75363.1 50S ribosomal protein L23 [Alphaproteobacteria bacterium]HNW73866.1 50S ribosomal protein L23 [Bacteroidales bacterium]HPS50106.1 50S ribosomal protein L23 [Bacteroidales bacterium]
MTVIMKPIITEKMTHLGEKLNRYGFLVDRRANKLQIKTAIKELYGVDVASVNTLVFSGKNKSRFTKSGVISGRTSAYKKAIVTLAKGETIDFYSNI